MKLIDISTPKHPNTFAVVDDEDFEWLNQWKWHPVRNRNTFYAYRTTPTGKRKTISMHKLIAGKDPNTLCDHRDGNGLNNTRANLRNCSTSQNNYNQPKRSKNASSKYKGVTWSKAQKRFCARISVGNRDIHLGSFKVENEAALAYNAAALKYGGEYARLNVIS